MLPLQKAAHSPPRHRTLVAWHEVKEALQLQRLLGELDYRVVGPAANREEAERLIARPFGMQSRIDCALLHALLPEASAVADRLERESIPLVWLVPDGDAVLPARHAHAAILDRPFDRAALAAAIEEAERRQTARRLYVSPPPQPVWPRIFPQL